MKKIITILLFLLAATHFAQTSAVPFLRSPIDGARYVKTTKLTLSWFVLSGVESYQVQLATDTFFTPTSLIYEAVRAGESITAPELQQNTTYYWRVRIDDAEAEWSDIWSFTTTVDPRPINLISPANGTTNLPKDLIIFEWTKDSANATYNFQLSDDSEFADTLRNLTVEDEMLELTNLGSGTIFYWRVKPFNADGIRGNWTETFSFKTKLNKASLIFPGNFTNNIDTSIVFRWNKVSLASYYTFQLATHDEFDDTSIVFTNKSIFTNVKVDSLQHERIYYWRVLATNAFNDSSSWSDPFAFKTKLPPPVLFLPENEKRNVDQPVLFKWDRYRIDDGYRFQVSADSLFTDNMLDRFLFTDSLLVANFDYGTAYYWRVNRRNELGDTSNWSTVSSIKTLLETPKIISPTHNSTTVYAKTEFSWSEVDDADDYRYQLSVDSLFTNTLYNFITEDTSVTINQLEPEQSYYYRVRAQNDDKDTSKFTKATRFNTFLLNISTNSINERLNFSTSPRDSIFSLEIENNGSTQVNLTSIFAEPDTLFFAEPQNKILNPSDSFFINIIADTSRMDTGSYSGTLNIERLLDSFSDTLTIPIDLRVFKAVAGIDKKVIEFDTTLSTSAKTEYFYLSNREGNYRLSVTDIYFEGKDSLAFKTNQDIEPIQPGDSVRVNISFTPVRKDSNVAVMVIETNSYPNRLLRMPLLGFGKGGQFTDATVNQLTQLENELFETITNNRKELVFRNNSTNRIDFNFDFVENYFKILDEKSEYKLLPGDSVLVTLLYRTPNLDTLNIDTLKIFHNGLGPKPYKVVLSGGFDLEATSQLVKDNLTINGSEFTGDDYIIDSGSPIRAVLHNDIFEDQDNVEFRLNYFIGGPSKKQNAIKSSNNYIIPSANTTHRGLLFKGELYTKGLINSKADSVDLFDVVDVQVVTDKYTTKEITIPKSVAGNSAADADTKWVMFGFPYEEVLADTVFEFFGGVRKMEDGQWIVYEYDETAPNSFKKFNGRVLEPNRGYFIAQAIDNDVILNYTYKNLISSKKLTDTVLTVPGSGWRTISSPFTFDVETDSNSTLYRYDTDRRSYRLTNVMRPGEAYFISPDLIELKLKTYGEYFPLVFPKTIANSDWFAEFKISTGEREEVLYSAQLKSDALQKTSAASSTNFLKGPKIQNGFDAYFKQEDNDNKYQAIKNDFVTGKTFELYLNDSKSDDGLIEIEVHDKIGLGLRMVFVNTFTGLVTEVSSNQFTISSKANAAYKIIIGSDEYVKTMIDQIRANTPTKFKLAQNYPNPFNPTTTIKFSIPPVERSGTSLYNAQLIVYDILGREVATLVNKPMPPGNYEVEFDATGLSSGVYFYRIAIQSDRLSVSDFTDVKKMLILK